MTQFIIRRLTSLLVILGAIAFFNLEIAAQGFPSGQSHVTDLKPGSVLFFNRYTSSPNNPLQGDTQINITNVNQSREAFLHVFFIDGSTCAITDWSMSLTPNQTTSFQMSYYDPGITGYVVVVATDGIVPTQFNSLIGTAYIRESDGRTAILQAISIAKRAPDNILPKDDGSYSLIFNGVIYEQLPATVAVSSFNSQSTDFSSLTIYSPTNDLTYGSVDSISVFTLIFNEMEKSISSSFAFRCYKTENFNVLFNRGGGINNHVPSGRTGWIRMSASGRPLLGSVITKGPVFSGGYNLHPITLLGSYEITLPVF